MALTASSWTARTTSPVRSSGRLAWVAWAATAARSAYSDPASNSWAKITAASALGGCAGPGAAAGWVGLPGGRWGSPVMGNHQVDAGQVGRAQQGESGGDRGMAHQDGCAGWIK